MITYTRRRPQQPQVQPTGPTDGRLLASTTEGPASGIDDIANALIDDLDDDTNEAVARAFEKLEVASIQ